MDPPRFLLFSGKADDYTAGGLDGEGEASHQSESLFRFRVARTPGSPEKGVGQRNGVQNKGKRKVQDDERSGGDVAVPVIAPVCTEDQEGGVSDSSIWARGALEIVDAKAPTLCKEYAPKKNHN